jgi:hypothetical protein
MKPKSVASYLKNTIMPLFGLWIRLRGCRRTTGTLTHGQCITCKKIFAFENLQCGHWQSRRHKSTLLYPHNVDIQCAYCNRWKGGDETFRKSLVELYGEREVDVIYYMAMNEIKQFTIEELQKLKKTYEQNIEKLKGSAK